MATLKAILENLDELPADLHQYYVEAKVKGPDGKDKDVFALDLGDSVREHPGVIALQSAHERVKQSNAALRTKLQELEAKLKNLPEDFTAETLEALNAELAELKEAKGEPDPTKREELATIRKNLDQQIARLKTQLAEKDTEHAKEKAALEKEIEGMLVDDGLTKALIEAGIKGPFMKAAMAMLRQQIKVVKDDDGRRAVAETDLGQVELAKFVQDWAGSDEGKEFVTKPTGSGAREGNTRVNGANPWEDKTWNVTQQQAIMTENPTKADSMIKAAGYRDAGHALLEHDKKTLRQGLGGRRLLRTFNRDWPLGQRQGEPIANGD